LKGSDISAIKSASEKLNEGWQAASAEMYKAAAAESAKSRQQQSGPKSGPPPGSGSGPGPGPGSGSKEEGPIIDAEVVDEKK